MEPVSYIYIVSEWQINGLICHMAAEMHLFVPNVVKISDKAEDFNYNEVSLTRSTEIVKGGFYYKEYTRYTDH
jgi:hypothetical protein